MRETVARQERDVESFQAAINKQAGRHEQHTGCHAFPAHIHAQELTGFSRIRLQDGRHDARPDERTVLHDGKELKTPQEQRQEK